METLVDLAEGLRKQGREQVIDFWLRFGIDKECGGYWTDLARDGSRYGDGTKWIIVQARNIYSFCLAYQWFGEQQYLDQAAQGVAFFREHFRDKKNGAWYHAVSRDGSEVVNDTKQPYGLSFVSYGFAEYARLTGDKDVLADAAETHALVMEKCWDKQRGGLPNMFTSDWQLIEGIKRVDTHMHTMEGVSALYRATGDAAYLQRLNQLADVILGTPGKDGCYDAMHGCTKEMFHMDWTEALERTQGHSNLGHITEAGWFINKLAAFTGDERKLSLSRGLVDWAIRVGFDEKRGGLHDYASVDGVVTRDVKVWWNQAELLGALAFLYRTTGEESYLEHLRKQITFLNRDMLDPTYGEWFPMLEADGRVADAGGTRHDFKGSRYKAAYHVIQGLYHASRDLERAAGVLPVASPKSYADYCL